jgi:hypothetical protein
LKVKRLSALGKAIQGTRDYNELRGQKGAEKGRKGANTGNDAGSPVCIQNMSEVVISCHMYM